MMSRQISQHCMFIGCAWFAGSLLVSIGAKEILGWPGFLISWGIAVQLAAILEAIDPSPEDEPQPLSAGERP